jgi:hypothetical protein
MALGSTQLLTDMSTTNLHEGKKWPARRTDNLAAICETNVLENVGASTSRNPKGLHGLYVDNFTFYIQGRSVREASKEEPKCQFWQYLA